MRFHFPVIMLLFLTWFSACKPDVKEKELALWKAEEVMLSCDSVGSSDNPSYAVYLQVKDRKVKIAQIAVECSLIDPNNFSTYNIPADALRAVGGWWAGTGEYLYAINEENGLSIYQGTVDEMQEEPGYNYRRIGTFDGKRFNISLPVYKSDLVGLYTLSGESHSWLLFIGLHEDTLTGQFFEADGPLPSKEHLIHYLPTLKPVELPAITLDEATLKFESAIGSGQFSRNDNNYSVHFDERTNQRGETLTLLKIE